MSGGATVIKICGHESLVAGARERKRLNYYDLVEPGKEAGYRSHLITVEVGSRGMLGDLP